MDRSLVSNCLDIQNWASFLASSLLLTMEKETLVLAMAFVTVMEPNSKEATEAENQTRSIKLLNANH